MQGEERKPKTSSIKKKKVKKKGRQARPTSYREKHDKPDPRFVPDGLERRHEEADEEERAHDAGGRHRRRVVRVEREAVLQHDGRAGGVEAQGER